MSTEHIRVVENIGRSPVKSNSVGAMVGRRKNLGLMKLEQRERGDLIEVYKILKGLTRIDPTLFWEVREQGR